MKLTLLGTGCPVVSTTRFGPANWIESGDTNLLIDCGSGVTQRMLAAGRSGPDVDALFLTHLHSDHVVDLFQLVLSSWHQGRQRPLTVYGPRGTKRFVGGLMEVWRPELEQRIAYEKRTSTAALEVDVVEVSGGDVIHLAKLSVAVVEVDHGPVEPAFGFVFADDHHRLAISGDTRYCPALIEAARDVDVLVHEVYLHREVAGPGAMRTAEGIANVKAYHTPSDEVGRVASECAAEKLVLTHFVPPEFDHALLMRDVSDSFEGEIIIGEDLLTIDL